MSLLFSLILSGSESVSGSRLSFVCLLSFSVSLSRERTIVCLWPKVCPWLEPCSSQTNNLHVKDMFIPQLPKRLELRPHLHALLGTS